MRFYTRQNILHFKRMCLIVFWIGLTRLTLSFYFPHECIEQYLNEIIFPSQLRFCDGFIRFNSSLSKPIAFCTCFFFILSLFCVYAVVHCSNCFSFGCNYHASRSLNMRISKYNALVCGFLGFKGVKIFSAVN